MSIVDRFLGLISAPAYALQRSKVAFVRLHVAAMLLGPLGAAYVAFLDWHSGLTSTHGAVMAMCLLCSALLLWAHRQRYVVFRARSITIPVGTPDLRAEQKLFLSGSGIFEVSGMRRYLVEVPVVFWTTELAEHIVAAKVRAFNLLGVGVPGSERGWWYVFLEPPRVLEIEPGDLCFGLRVRPAVRVLYRTPRGRDTLYLSCRDTQQLAVVLTELRARAKHL